MSEYRTIIHCTEELETALLSDRAILLFLKGEGFIEPNVYDDVTNPKSLLSASEKAGLLVTGIKNKVDLNPKNYHKLMRHFHQDRRMYGDIADIMDKEYLKQGGKFTLSQSYFYVPTCEGQMSDPLPNCYAWIGLDLTYVHGANHDPCFTAIHIGPSKVSILSCNLSHIWS